MKLKFLKKKKILKMLDFFNINYEEFTERLYIHELAISDGAISSISLINARIDFNFNKDNIMMGISGEGKHQYTAFVKKE